MHAGGAALGEKDSLPGRDDAELQTAGRAHLSDLLGLRANARGHGSERVVYRGARG